MKNFFLLALSIILLASCSNDPFKQIGRYQNKQAKQQAKNHSGIREWKAGKQMARNRRQNERPQCVDSW